MKLWFCFHSFYLFIFEKLKIHFFSWHFLALLLWNNANYTKIAIIICMWYLDLKKLSLVCVIFIMCPALMLRECKIMLNADSPFFWRNGDLYKTTIGHLSWRGNICFFNLFCNSFKWIKFRVMHCLKSEKEGRDFVRRKRLLNLGLGKCAFLIVKIFIRAFHQCSLLDLGRVKVNSSTIWALLLCVD